MDQFSSQSVAVVTGAASGIGLGIARRFAEAGNPVLMIDRDQDLLEREAAALASEGARICACAADVVERDQIEAAYARARSELGPIRIVVANAGISNMQPFAQMTLDQWQQMLDVNLTGVFHTVQAALPDMLEGQWGRIITISSQAGQSGGPAQAHYSATKGGVIAMTKALARELASLGITANTIPPSLVETPLMKQAVEAGTFPIEQVLPAIPISRPGQPEEIGDACVFLASDKAAYITGQVLAVNGGMYM